MIYQTPPWNIVKLEDVGDILNGLTYEPGSVSRSGTLVLRSSNIQNGRLAFDDNVYVNCSIPERIRIRDQDILICVRNGSRRLIGKSTSLDRRVVGQTFGAFMAVFRSDANPYLQYFFQSDDFSRQVDEHLGATINQITNGSLKGFVVALPGNVERQAIAECLGDADDLIGKLQCMIAKKKAIMQGMMQQLLTGETRLPGLSEAWREVILGDVVSYLKTASLSRAQLDVSSPLRYIHYGDIHASSTIMFDGTRGAIPRVPSSLAVTAGQLRVGDLVLVDASEDRLGVGKSVEVASVPCGGIVAGLHTIAARFDKNVLADGFKAYLQFIPAFRVAILRLAAGTKVLATTRSHISSVILSLPSIDEQRAIVSVLGDCDAEIAALQVYLVKLMAIKQGMMNELLTGRTRLPVNEAAVA